jgi:hypothetical protein
MREVIFNEKSYQVPESWDEVSLKMIIEASKLSDILPDAPIICIISGYVGIPSSELKVSKLDAVNEIVSIMSFINSEYVPVPRNSFDFRGFHYECISDLADQEFGDFVSIQTILYNYRENPLDGLARMLAVYARKPGETLDDIDLDARQLLFLELPFTIAKDLEVFFSQNVIAWRTISQWYLSQEEKERFILQQFDELRNTMSKRKVDNGTSWLMKLQIGAWLMCLKYLKKQTVKHFNSGHSKS